MNCKPLTDVTVNLPVDLNVNGNEKILEIDAVLKDSQSWAKAGHEVAFEQFQIPEQKSRFFL